MMPLTTQSGFINTMRKFAHKVDIKDKYNKTSWDSDDDKDNEEEDEDEEWD